MAKILVADDNSNIQRMVGLALKDQGIEVVAVGNGEAAVRKISELRPDLVLADVFMPVRNGYEVCQYVKEDASLAHIPVILLVGAFDPLDEQEAQRVGADGVLKKPFVPPDPLIAMVKAALLRAGISLSPGGTQKTSAPPARKAADLLPPAQPPPAKSISSPLAGIAFSASSARESLAPLVGDESFVDMPARQEPVRIDAAKHTMAFGNLLGPTATSEDPGFAAEEMETISGSDWRALEETQDVPEEEEEESKESVPPWRRDGTESIFRGEDATGPVKDWRDSAVVQTAGRTSAREIWEQAEEKGGFVTAAEVPTELGAFATEVSALEAETQAVSLRGSSEISQEKSFPQSPTFSADAASAAVAAHPEIQPIELPATAAETAHAHGGGQFVIEARAAEVPSGPAGGEESAGAMETPAAPEIEAEHADANIPAHSWFSRPSSPWDAAAQQTNPLAASWESGSAARETGMAAMVKDNSSETQSNGESSPEEAARVLSDEPAADVAGTGASATEAEMDALIAKVLSRISPEVLHAVTREILKPAVAAILAEEFKLKK